MHSYIAAKSSSSPQVTANAERKNQLDTIISTPSKIAARLSHTSIVWAGFGNNLLVEN